MYWFQFQGVCKRIFSPLQLLLLIVHAAPLEKLDRACRRSIQRKEAKQSLGDGGYELAAIGRVYVMAGTITRN
jgi:hypothetical protein